MGEQSHRFKKRGFTLVELLTVISIIAILAAVFAPVIASVKGAVYQSMATQSLKQVMSGVSMYASDHDETFPPALYAEPDGSWQLWNARVAPGQKPDPEAGLITSYIRGKITSDPTLHADPYLGDSRGYGYNWGYLGSDFHLRKDYASFPQCANPARFSELSNPSGTIAFATSSFFFAEWDGGDNKTYDFSFIDPPEFWAGNPNMDFRHRVPKQIDRVNHRVNHEGFAVVLFADGSCKPMARRTVADTMFRRLQNQPDQVDFAKTGRSGEHESRPNGSPPGSDQRGRPGSKDHPGMTPWKNFQ